MDQEFVIVLPSSLGGANVNQIFNLVLDVVAHGLSINVDYGIGATLEVVNVMPKTWATRSLLFDEPRGEAEELAAFHIGSQHVDLLWIVPMHQKEIELIRNQGLDVLRDWEAGAEFDLIDPERPSFIDS
ncbi:MAG: suppressor of fused domain protein [Planctomycetaceae bacterium]|nr:suppressor of fused domain protein [Planctomycetaceae bacterium]